MWITVKLGETRMPYFDYYSTLLCEYQYPSTRHAPLSIIKFGIIGILFTFQVDIIEAHHVI